ncbi:MAG TPA: hypothetical protein VH143_21730 [Kofleriaceae bacterium]|jgi:hypothetical protein|nr:hypothetical protein [Kofleriaceae bacterium]
MADQVTDKLGVEVRAFLADLTSRVERIAQAVTDEQMPRAVDETLDLLAHVRRSAGDDAFARHGIDADAIAQSLSLLAGWLAAPSPQTQAAVDRLRAAVHEQTERETAAEIERTVRASLEEIFAVPPPNPLA